CANAAFEPRAHSCTKRSQASRRVDAGNAANAWGESRLKQWLALVNDQTGRSERIRTSDPVVPNDVRYQAALHSATRRRAYNWHDLKSQAETTCRDDHD